MKALFVLMIVCVVAATATVAYASDLNFGSTARCTAMGGAGLALGDDSGTTSVLNPAAPAVSGQRFRFIFPGLDFHTTGASFGDLADSISKMTSGSSADALDLVNNFAKQDTTLNVNLVTGFAGPLGLTVQAEGNALISPGPEAKKWASAVQTFTGNGLSSFKPQDWVGLLSNGDLTAAVADWHLVPGDPVAPNAADNAFAEGHFQDYLNQLNVNRVSANFVYALPAVSLSRGFETKKGTLFLGTNMKLLHGEAHNWLVNGAVQGGAAGFTYAGGALSGINLGFNAVELPAQKSNTFQADFGLVYKPSQSMFQYGLVVNNFIEPDLKGFTNTQTDRMYSAGIAALPVPGMVLAADLININKANGEKTALRMGGEYRLGRFLAVRAGYSGSNWTYGLGVLGLNFAWAGNSAQLLSNLLKF